jgi:hypothetical protein
MPARKDAKIMEGSLLNLVVHDLIHIPGSQIIS